MGMGICVLSTFQEVGLFNFMIGSQVAESRGAFPEEWEILIHDQKTCFDQCALEVIQI
ncbi:hypothetical protein F4782DRAFT_487537, partial [Xylaria castorea]